MSIITDEDVLKLLKLEVGDEFIIEKTLGVHRYKIIYEEDTKKYYAQLLDINGCKDILQGLHNISAFINIEIKKVSSNTKLSYDVFDKCCNEFRKNTCIGCPFKGMLCDLIGISSINVSLKENIKDYLLYLRTTKKDLRTQQKPFYLKYYLIVYLPYKLEYVMHQFFELVNIFITIY